MGGRGGGAPGNAGRGNSAAQPSPADFQRDITTTAIRQALARNPNSNWALLTAVRANMTARGITSRDAQDAEIRRLVNSGEAQMIPMANLKALSPGEREAAIRVGGELKHLIRI
jgi:hypothetical protein